jgi:hypothetical protein
LKEVDNALLCYDCSKCNLRVFHNYTSYERHETCCDGSNLTKKLIPSFLERSIDPNYDFNPRNQYLTLISQKQKYRPTRYYITYDIETIEKKIYNEDIEDAKNPTKILCYIYPLFVDGDLKLYYDMRDGDDFMQKWFIAVLKQDKIVENENRYVDVGDDSNLPNDVVMFGYNNSNFDLDCFLPILQNPLDWFIVSIIGKLTHFKMIKVKSVDGITLKFLDTMNFTVHQPLKDFVKSFGSKGCDLKSMFAYEAINADNYTFVLVEKRPFAKDDFKSYLKNSSV